MKTLLVVVVSLCVGFLAGQSRPKKSNPVPLEAAILSDEDVCVYQLLDPSSAPSGVFKPHSIEIDGVNHKMSPNPVTSDNPLWVVELGGGRIKVFSTRN